MMYYGRAMRFVLPATRVLFTSFLLDVTMNDYERATDTPYRGLAFGYLVPREELDVRRCLTWVCNNMTSIYNYKDGHT